MGGGCGPMGRREGPHGEGGPAASGAALHDVGKGREGQIGNCAEGCPRETGGSLGKGIKVKEVNLGWRTKWRRRTTRRRLMISSSGFGVSFLQPVKNITPLRSLDVSVCSFILSVVNTGPVSM
jgi:hypothetical protein